LTDLLLSVPLISRHASAALLPPPSFPTRRSSDLRPPATSSARSTRPAARSRALRSPTTKSWPTTTSGGSTGGCPSAGGSASTTEDRKSTRLNSSHVKISYAVFCLKKKKKIIKDHE